MNRKLPKTASRLVWCAFALLFLLHHDFWLWDNETLVLGFLPVGLLYHVLFSIAASALWACTLIFAWPDHIEEWANAPGRHQPHDPKPPSVPGK
jgi:hypothetical protein